MSFQTITSESEISNMKANLRAMQNKRDNLAITVAKILNLPSIWTLEMVDWNNPEVHDIGEQIKQLDIKINKLSWKIKETIAINEGHHDLFTAEKKVYAFLGRLTVEEGLAYLSQLGLTTHGLISEVAKNPNFISETYGVEV